MRQQYLAHCHSIRTLRMLCIGDEERGKGATAYGVELRDYHVGNF